MTFQAPAHVERLAELDHFHFRDIAVTRNTTHPGIDMGRVIEVSIVREVVDANPFYRLLSGKALAHQGQFFTVRVDHRMTVHTGPSWRHVGLRLALHPGMTIATINAQIPGVNFV